MPVDFHSTRRAYSTALARAGVNAQTAQILAGHSSADVHQRYVASTVTALPDAAMPRLPLSLVPQADKTPRRDRLPRRINRATSLDKRD